jgi:hypothetical protein
MQRKKSKEKFYTYCRKQTKKFTKRIFFALQQLYNLRNNNSDGVAGNKSQLRRGLLLSDVGIFVKNAPAAVLLILHQILEVCADCLMKRQKGRILGVVGLKLESGTWKNCKELPLRRSAKFQRSRRFELGSWRLKMGSCVRC